MGQFKYLGAIIALVTILFVVIIGTFALLKKYTNYLERPIFDGKTLDKAGGTHDLLKQNSWGIRMLCLTRFIFFIWFAVFNTVYRMFFISPRGWNYYTNWNIYLIGFYYTFALICAVLVVKKESFHWTPLVKARADVIAKIASILYTVAGSAAIMISVLNFILLNPSFTFWNVTLHLSTSVSLFVDMSLNDMTVNAQDVIFSIVWPYCYLIFIWPIVKEGVRGGWPYFFVETEKASAFFWYFFLFFLSIVFFALFYGLHCGKEVLITRRLRKIGQHEPVPEHELESNSDHQSFHSVSGIEAS